MYDFRDDSSITNYILNWNWNYGYYNIYSSSGRIDNAGLFLKSGGTGQSAVGVAFNNTGTLEVDSGTLALQAGGTSTNANYVFTNSGRTRLQGGWVLQGTNTISGAGVLELNADIAVANGEAAKFVTATTDGIPIEITGGNLHPSAGGSLTLDLAGTSKVRMTARLCWRHGCDHSSRKLPNAGRFHWWCRGSYEHKGLRVVGGDDHRQRRADEHFPGVHDYRK